MNSERLDPETYGELAAFIHALTGMVLGPDKIHLVVNRLGSRIDHLGMSGYDQYLAYVRADESGEELSNMVNALTTNTTRFFREPDHFVFMRKVIQKWLREGQKRFRIWSAASSTGEEPYSIAMVLSEVFGGQPTDTRILCTDIDSIALEACREGWFSAQKVADIPLALPMRFFTKVRRGSTGTEVMVDESLKELCSYCRMNLMDTPYRMKGPFDLIFCRNVMIYFDNELRRRVLNECSRLLREDGYLFVGGSEALVGMLSHFKSVQPSVYRK